MKHSNKIANITHYSFGVKTVSGRETPPCFVWMRECNIFRCFSGFPVFVYSSIQLNITPKPFTYMASVFHLPWPQCVDRQRQD